MTSAVRRLLALSAALLLLPAWAAAQESATITGQVTTAGGDPIAGATILVEGMNLGTLTNVDGRFMLVIPASRVMGQQVDVTASQLGYKPVTETITLTGGSATLDFALADDPLRLEEIVVTGQGTQQERRKLGVAINTVDGEALSRSNESNTVAALAGKAPNVEITSNAGDPGASAYIRIRGAASIVGGTQPLFVVDGTPIDNSSHRTEGSHAGTVTSNAVIDLNPDDIESIDILKGAAAAAIYGSRAANGVVLITTKSGRPGQSRFTYSTNFTFDEVNATVPLQTSWSQGLHCAPLTPEERTEEGCSGPDDEFAPTTSVTWGAALDPGTRVYDHANEVLQDGYRFENNLTFSGGSERTTYFLSVGRMDHDGTIVGNQEYNRTTVRLKGTHSFTDDLTIGGNFAYTDGVGDFIQHGSNVSGIWLGALRTPPEFNNQPYIDPETGLHRSYRYPNPTLLARGRGYDNPFWIANEILNEADVGRAFGNVSADYSPMPWLTFNLVVGADYRNDERKTLFPKSSSSYPNGQLIRANFVDLRYDESLTMTATRDLTPDISGSVTLGQNLNHAEYRRYQTDGSNLIFGTEELDFVVTPTPDEYKEVIRTDGYFGQAQVDFYNLLTLTGNLRRDGANTFGGAGSHFWYPGVSASFRFQDLVNVDFLSFGRVRAAWGVTGRQPEPFSNISAYTKGFFSDGWLGDGVQSIYLGQEGVVRQGTAGNPDIEPERETEIEVGVDLAFLEDRVNLGVTYYDRQTEDAIIEKPVPTSTGFFARYENAAEWYNKGWEATLDIVPIRTDNFSWSIGGQWARNESCVTDLAGANDVYLAGFTGSQVSLVAPEDPSDPEGTCHPWGVFFTDDFVRFGRGEVVGGVEIDNAYPDAAPGDVYIAEDGFPVYDSDLNVSGDPNPDWTAGIRSTFTFFNNLRVSALVDIRQGQDAWNGTKGALYYFGTHADTEEMHGAGQPWVFEGHGPGAGTEVMRNWNTWTIGGIGSGFTGPSTLFI
ncbi:MAG: SusC/RagA family TonB-linked outer membrane protein, partial [Gemmatimonadetes bacterium]|nr:SusC/RagA family TonB-linked outer membrane protein [Gemmatimonadota bacterium]NIQ54345.1 SusC/RagA family TonB-linked outer membrane protein [Gemmatimonadota bacterium]NIU74555.1 SusC/RagA family TonB-linked outer membrane protein [Gammaproteobacteria bacterium]NIX44490.1 SusC/RagA family TonB-linked outer membrane protein [Gemmatimonadota bacterium]NIY08720.1 SusC/RagA family TonB-linked outer membrane protein [Gemmatimonadota bacterium]